MTFDRSHSRCSKPGQNAFHWFDCIQRPEEDPIETAVQRFVDAIRTDRLLNPYAEIALEEACRARLQRASRGDLKPVFEVEGVDEERPAPLYEIKWKDLAVTDRDPGSPTGVKHSQIEVRMYHSEPESLPQHLIGHHVHEKDVSVPEEVNTRQDAEIAIARNYYHIGESTRWGLD